jgi:hypothetical protein
MAKAKTGSFYLTETVELVAGTLSGVRVQGSIDLGAYVSIAQNQAIAIDKVDFIFQHSSIYALDVASFLVGNGALGCQVTDLNPGTAYVRADNQSLVASGGLNIDTINSIASHQSDIYPDNFGPSSLSEMFLVVNDTLYIVAGVDNNNVGAASMFITARLRCRIISLSAENWRAIALQATASDN